MENRKTGETFESAFGAFVNGDGSPEALLKPDAVLNCWQFVETSLALAGVFNWSFQVLRQHKRIALRRCQALDDWLHSTGVLSQGEVSDHANILFQAHGLGMLGCLDAHLWATRVNDKIHFDDACPPLGSIVRIGHSQHFLISSDAPRTGDASPRSCHFVQLSWGGSDDSLDCWNMEYKEQHCNASCVFETDLYYLSKLQYWDLNMGGSLDDIHFGDPRDGLAVLTPAEHIEVWVSMQAQLPDKWFGTHGNLTETLYELHKRGATGFDSQALLHAGIDPGELAIRAGDRQKGNVDNGKIVDFLKPFFLSAIEKADAVEI